MADVTVKTTRLIETNKLGAVDAETAAASDDIYIEADGRDGIFYFTCGSVAGDITVKAGTGYAANKDLTLTLTASTPYAIQLDTAAYLGASGKIKITCPSTTNFALTNLSFVSLR